MQSQADTLQNLEYILRRWDEDMRFGCRGLEQLTRVLQEARVSGHEFSGEFSGDDLVEALCPDRLATFRMLATSLLENIPRLLAEITDFESSDAFVARHS